MPRPFDPQAFQAFERAGWERVGDDYDDSFGRVTRQSTAPLLDAAQVGPGTRVLDVACGPGYVTAAAAARGAQAIGIDFAATVVAAAQKQHPRAEFRQGDAEALDFPDGSFDAVVCSFGVLHFPQPERAVAEAFRVLKRGGRYAITDWIPPAPGTFLGLFADAIKRYGDPKVPVPQGPPVGQFTDRDYCTRVFTAAGFAPPRFVLLTPTLRGTPAARVADVLTRGVVRMGGLFNMQTPAAQAAIRAGIAAEARRFEKDGEALIPCPASLAWAVRPA